MHNLFLIFVLCLFYHTSNAQEWKSLLEKARIDYKNGKYPNAYQGYLNAEKKAPKTISFSSEIAQSAYKAKLYKEANQQYTKSKPAAKNALKKAHNFHNLGNTYLQQKNYPKAIEAYKDALRKKPSDNETRYNLALAKKEYLKKEKNNRNPPKNKDNNKKPEPKKNKENTSQKENEENKRKENIKKQENETEKNIKDQQTNRMLDDLLKKEIDTKKKNNKANAPETPSENGKDW
jgi:Ca-activated chloride channel family protein